MCLDYGLSFAIHDFIQKYASKLSHSHKRLKGLPSLHIHSTF